jgi:hypothetical protein
MGRERRVPTLQFYVPDDVADALRARAEERGANLSNYLSEIVVRHLRRDWPEAWVDTAAAAWDDEWRGSPGVRKRRTALASSVTGVMSTSSPQAKACG